LLPARLTVLEPGGAATLRLAALGVLAAAAVVLRLRDPARRPPASGE
jgi:hypothetical protein